MSRAKIEQFIALLKVHIKTYMSISIAVFFFILFFQPFSFDRFEFENKLLFIAGFGFITFVFLILAQIFFLKLFAEKETIQYENYFLTYIYDFTLLSATSLAFVFYIRYVGENKISFYTVVKVISICIFPPVVLHIRTNFEELRNKYRKINQEFRLMQNKLKQFSDNFSNKYIELVSDSDSENFRLQISNIMFIKSADNYVEIGYRDGNEPKKKLIRNTLKNIEGQLKEYNNFVRTHRTCIVNIQCVGRLNKSFNTYWLTLADSPEAIPVSRQYLMIVKDVLQ